MTSSSRRAAGWPPSGPDLPIPSHRSEAVHSSRNRSGGVRASRPTVPPMTFAATTVALLTLLALAPSIEGTAEGQDAVPALQSGGALLDRQEALEEQAAGAWSWPLEPRPVVMLRFLAPQQPWLSGHRGVDLLADGVGVPVRAPADGLVRFRGLVAGVEVVVIEHAGGLRSTFQPVTSTLRVGARVGRGEIVGALTGTPGHCAPRTCLHWGVLRGADYLDPLALVRRSPVRLLPLE